MQTNIQSQVQNKQILDSNSNHEAFLLLLQLRSPSDVRVE